VTKIARREFLRLAGLTAAGAALASCAPKTVEVTKEVQVEKIVTKVVEKAVTPTAAPAIVTPQGRTLPADAAALDKQILYDQAAQEVQHLDIVRDLYASNVMLNFVAEPLLRLDENYQIIPSLADSFTVGPGAAYTDFKINKDVVWSDGTPITADDVVWTFQHAADPAMKNPFLWFWADIKGVAAVGQGKADAKTIGVEKIDDKTVRVYGEKPAPHLPALFTYQCAVLSPKHKAEKDPQNWTNDWQKNFVSSGQWVLTKWDHNQRYEFEINKNYKGPLKAGFQKVIQLIGTVQTNWFNGWLNKEIDWVLSMDAATLARCRADAKLNAQLHWFPNMQTSYIAMDTTIKPLDDVKVRMAMAKSIDRDTFCSKVMLGTAVSGYSMLPPGFPAYNAELKSIQAFDVTAAKKLLADAGYKDGKDASGAQLTIDFCQNSTDTAIPVFVKEQWETNLGIKVNITVLENTVWRAKRNAKELGMIFKNTYEYDYMDPANLLTMIWKSIDDKGSPQIKFKNKAMDDLFTAAGTEMDPAKRVKLFQDAEKILVTEVGGIFMTHQLIFQIWWPYMKGFPTDKNGNTAMHYLDGRYQYYIGKEEADYRKAH
jgi:oligopeptide transport system substrate-binding protein